MAALQAFIIFDNERNSCPMESLLGNPLALEDETQIISIQSSYENYHNRRYSCNWKFSAPFGYGFKIVIESFHTTSKFIVENTTEAFLNNRIVQTYYPFYNSDNFIQISLSPTVFTAYMELKSYISIVKMHQTSQEMNCPVTETDNIITWSNFNYNNDEGYHNNVHCNFKLVIPTNTEILVDVSLEGVEKGIDYISYHSEINNKSIKLLESIEHKIDAHYDGTNRSMFWEFISDGSFQAAGFIITFKKTNCNCAKSIVKCDNFTYGIMGGDNNFYYCSNLHCIFEIQPCNTSFTLFQVFSFNDKIYDVFEVTSNNETVLEINQLNIKIEYTYNIFLNSSKDNFFIADTYPSSHTTALYFVITPALLPEITTRIVLSLNNSSSVIDTAFNSFIVIEISPDLHNLNLSIFIYHLDDNGLDIYENETLTHNIIDHDCFGQFNVYRCEIKRNRVALLVKDSDTERIIIAEILKQSKGCVFAESTFVITSDKTVGTLANSESYCDITIMLSHLSFYIESFWTTATNKSVQIFAGTDYSSKLFLEITSTSAKTWNSIILNSKVYKLRIPKGSAFFIKIKQNSLNPYTISRHPFKTLFSTDSYGLAEISTYPNNIDFDVMTYSTKVTAIDYVIDVLDVVYFQDVKSLQIYYINKTGDFFIFKNQSLTLYYEQNVNINLKTGALFLVETIEEINL